MVLVTNTLMLKSNLIIKVRVSNLREKMNLPYVRLSSSICNGIQGLPYPFRYKILFPLPIWKPDTQRARFEPLGMFQNRRSVRISHSQGTHWPIVKT